MHNFDCVIGQSDHTNGILVPLYAIACGAQIIEKHYRISDDMECIDSPVSINEKQISVSGIFDTIDINDIDLRDMALDINNGRI